MKVFWCEIHESGRKAGSAPSRCEAADLIVLEGLWPVPCQFGPRRLIPDNAETVDREALSAALDYYDNNDEAFVMSHVPLYIAAARAYLALDGETP